MQTLYPIIRRVRRPLLPPDEPQQRVIIPVAMEPEPVEEVPIVMAPEEAAPVEPELAEPVMVEPSLVGTPPTRRSRKEKKRAETSTT